MQQQGWTAFHGDRIVDREEAAQLLMTEQWRDGDRASPSLLIFDAGGRALDVDLRLSAPEILAGLDRATEPAEAANSDQSAPRGPGRPKLGVVAREVTLLPRHWDWLAGRPGGASVALRKLVDEARRASDGADRIKRAQEAAYRFMHALAGDRVGYEDALRALYAHDPARFDALIESWPADIRAHARKLAAAAFGDDATFDAMERGV